MAAKAALAAALYGCCHGVDASQGKQGGRRGDAQKYPEFRVKHPETIQHTIE